MVCVSVREDVDYLAVQTHRSYINFLTSVHLHFVHYFEILGVQHWNINKKSNNYSKMNRNLMRYDLLQ